MTPAIMLQGTGSDVGKSLLVAGLCRAALRRGLRVRPFKPQNMSNNAAVTSDGGEIGRAQALQAMACAVPAQSVMNPVLLKPQSEIGSQVIIRGKVFGTASARDYRTLKPKLLQAVLDSFAELQAACDLVLVEGAGSPAEVNLRDGDIANMGFAEAADVPVALVGDIHRGGVIASLVGTHALLPPEERQRIKAYIINKFRGDPSLFTPALDIISDRTGWEALGIVAHSPLAKALPQEDGMALETPRPSATGPVDSRPDGPPLRIAVPRLPRIANFDDFDPLAAEPDVHLSFIDPGTPLPGDADLIILPGSKSTIADLQAFRVEGWDIDLAAHHRRGGRILGICAGFQMLGRSLEDPDGIEGSPGSCDGLGYLDVSTVLKGPKTLEARDMTPEPWRTRVTGYEMHMGITSGSDCHRAWLGPGSAANSNETVMGCYLHGLFGQDGFRAAFLRRIHPDRPDSSMAYHAGVEATLDALADHLEQHMEVDRILALARER